MRKTDTPHDPVEEKEFCSLCCLAFGSFEKKVDCGFDRKTKKRLWLHERCEAIHNRTLEQLRLGSLAR